MLMGLDYMPGKLDRLFVIPHLHAFLPQHLNSCYQKIDFKNHVSVYFDV